MNNYHWLAVTLFLLLSLSYFLVNDFYKTETIEIDRTNIHNLRLRNTELELTLSQKQHEIDSLRLLYDLKVDSISNELKKSNRKVYSLQDSLETNFQSLQNILDENIITDIDYDLLDSIGIASDSGKEE